MVSLLFWSTIQDFFPLPIPLCELIEEYLTVPMNDFPSLYSICYPVLGSLNRFARPKSIKYMWSAFFPVPIRKLSGLMSR